MQLVHSKLEPVVPPQPIKRAVVKEMTEEEEFALSMALKGYRAAIKKNWSAIAEIQETFPGWVPEFEY